MNGATVLSWAWVDIHFLRWLFLLRRWEGWGDSVTELRTEVRSVVAAGVIKQLSWIGKFRKIKMEDYKVKIQKTLLIPIVCSVVASTTSIADTAVSQTNVQVQASYGRADIDFFGFSDSVDSYAGQMALQVPLGSVFGASLQAVAGKVEFLFEDEDKYDYYLYMASLFARSPNHGLLGIGVGGSKVDLITPYGESWNTEYQVIAAGYLGPVTLALTRSYTEYDTYDTNEDSWADVTWYIVPNFLVNVTAGFMDAEDTYMIALEHQIGNSGLSYGLSYGWNNNNNVDTKDYYVVLSYRFGKSKSLQERYRHDLYSTR